MPYKTVRSDAQKRLDAIASLTVEDTAVVGVNGLLKQLGKGVLARLLAAEVAADQVDVLMFCE